MAYQGPTLTHTTPTPPADGEHARYEYDHEGHIMSGLLSALPSVLIIDDYQPLLESYIVLLENEFQVYTATTGEMGLACLQQQSIDLLLLDLQLPTIDGLEVLRRVKALDAHLPVIIVTAVNEAQPMAQAFKLGATDYVVKPCDIDTILRLLRRTLARAAPPRHHH